MKKILLSSCLLCCSLLILGQSDVIENKYFMQSWLDKDNKESRIIFNSATRQLVGYNLEDNNNWEKWHQDFHLDQFDTYGDELYISAVSNEKNGSCILVWDPETGQSKAFNRKDYWWKPFETNMPKYPVKDREGAIMFRPYASDIEILYIAYDQTSGKTASFKHPENKWQAVNLIFPKLPFKETDHIMMSTFRSGGKTEAYLFWDKKSGASAFYYWSRKERKILYFDQLPEDIVPGSTGDIMMHACYQCHTTADNKNKCADVIMAWDVKSKKYVGYTIDYSSGDHKFSISRGQGSFDNYKGDLMMQPYKIGNSENESGLLTWDVSTGAFNDFIWSAKNNKWIPRQTNSNLLELPQKDSLENKYHFSSWVNKNNKVEGRIIWNSQNRKSFGYNLKPVYGWNKWDYNLGLDGNSEALDKLGYDMRIVPFYDKDSESPVLLAFNPITGYSRGYRWREYWKTFDYNLPARPIKNPLGEVMHHPLVGVNGEQYYLVWDTKTGNSKIYMWKNRDWTAIENHLPNNPIENSKYVMIAPYLTGGRTEAFVIWDKFSGKAVLYYWNRNEKAFKYYDAFPEDIVPGSTGEIMIDACHQCSFDKDGKKICKDVYMAWDVESKNYVGYVLDNSAPKGERMKIKRGKGKINGIKGNLMMQLYNGSYDLKCDCNKNLLLLWDAATGKTYENEWNGRSKSWVRRASKQYDITLPE